MKSLSMVKDQMELGFDGSAASRPARRARVVSRSRWWFDHMRAVVDRAMEWRPAPAGRPEQTYLAVR